MRPGQKLEKAKRKTVGIGEIAKFSGNCFSLLLRTSDLCMSLLHTFRANYLHISTTRKVDLFWLMVSDILPIGTMTCRPTVEQSIIQSGMCDRQGYPSKRGRKQRDNS